MVDQSPLLQGGEGTQKKAHGYRRLGGDAARSPASFFSLSRARSADRRARRGTYGMMSEAASGHEGRGTQGRVVCIQCDN